MLVDITGQTVQDITRVISKIENVSAYMGLAMKEVKKKLMV